MKKLLFALMLAVQCLPATACFIEQFPVIENQIRQFYENEVFYTRKDPNYKITDICTPEFIDRLLKANDFDTETYATWLLRSGFQDGQDAPSMVLEVIPGSNNTAVVKWSDMGVEGSTTLSLVDCDGTWKIDNAIVPEGFNPL